MLNPPTLNRWASLLMVQWDNYVDLDPYPQKHPIFKKGKRLYFKKIESYKNYFSLVQLLDCTNL